ncbi:protein FAR1-RELATED SEQUENCE 5-like [Gossypium australe]|uniref:Protein FAR1-RELATED SEQUENCE 5-like n=1 Tax=Gossypium australe TaxID=47621 RepID=A0A5B6WS63_9ROSI|nr:protein FAR1-RELATED SEQUENCE 5-like [Gossypium australe]
MEDALEYNTKYAKQEDFGIRKNCITKYRKNQEIIGQLFVCSKDRKYLEKGDKVQEPSDETRVGYKALIYVSKKHVNKWMAYKYFGDVAFDPTYLTNRYKIPFVPFTRVNHHHSILFGCALLWDEIEETFVWLLNTWLEAMFSFHPKTIITDQDGGIINAVAMV